MSQHTSAPPLLDVPSVAAVCLAYVDSAIDNSDNSNSKRLEQIDWDWPHYPLELQNSDLGELYKPNPFGLSSTLHSVSPDSPKKRLELVISRDVTLVDGTTGTYNDDVARHIVNSLHDLITKGEDHFSDAAITQSRDYTGLPNLDERSVAAFMILESFLPEDVVEDARASTEHGSGSLVSPGKTPTFVIPDNKDYFEIVISVAPSGATADPAAGKDMETPI
jgi:hypothetical protein